METVFNFIFYFILVSVHCNANNLKINGLVDELLGKVSKSFIETGTDTQPIDDMEENFTVMFMHGGLNATGGVFRNLSSVKRTGDAILDIGEDAFSIVVNLGLEDCNIYFKSCNGWLGYLSMTEEVSATVTNNSLRARISLKVTGDEDCTTTLDEVRLTELSGWDVDLKSLSYISYIVDNLIDWIIEWYEDSIRSSLELQLTNSIKAQLMNVDFCSLIS